MDRRSTGLLGFPRDTRALTGNGQLRDRPTDGRHDRTGRMATIRALRAGEQRHPARP